LSEGSRHFEENSAVFEALHKIAEKLNGLDIPYAVVGGMALFKHGLRRFTEDVDILVTKEGLRVIHGKLAGLGYLPPHQNSKHLRDTQLGVRIEFLTTGAFPGDGKVSPVSFPDPAAVGFKSENISYIKLHNLVELKLASGMTGAGRMKDLSDVMELIKALNLTPEFAHQLNPYVRDKYKELWKEARRRYVTTWRNKWVTAEAKTIEDVIASLRAAADHLDEMRRDGVTLEDRSSVGDDHAQLVTTDPNIAKKYDMVDEFEYWDQDEEDLFGDEGQNERQDPEGLSQNGPVDPPGG
jgi:hypothetical protein